MSMNDVHAPERVRCPSCGAKNAPGAEWCGQCLKRFEAPPPPPALAATAVEAPAPAAPAGAPAAAPAIKPGVERAGFRSTEEGILWRCASCDNENPLEAPACTVCGTLFAESIRPPGPERPQRDPGTTALISLFFPGAGHAYLGMWAQAVARALVSVWATSMTLFFAVSETGSTPIAAMYGLSAFALWITAAHDAFREASGQPRQVLLQGRRFTYLVLGLLMLLMGSLFLAALNR